MTDTQVATLREAAANLRRIRPEGKEAGIRLAVADLLAHCATRVEETPTAQGPVTQLALAVAHQVTEYSRQCCTS